MTKQTLAFQAEVAQLLHLVTHSLYSNKEIFLRELISNAADACDKLRFDSINTPEAYANEDSSNLAIRISVDNEQRTISVTDNGIGLSEQEAIDNLGTIAKSGTKDFVNQLSGDQQQDAQMIGQFGVGFYSGFIVADKITVRSRRAGLAAEQGVQWSSSGIGEFEVESITKAERGTEITLHLLEDASEFLNAWTLKQIINKYADHIALPILMEQEQWQESEVEGQPGSMVKTGEWETVNQASALWTRSKKDITAEQYTEFYKHISHDYQAPLAWSHNQVEGASEYTQLLYIPMHAPQDLWDPNSKSGLKLYVKRVFILDDAKALLPNYLRFVKGVVDSADLPLNVSREILQESRDVKVLRDSNTRRILTIIDELAKDADNQELPAEQHEKFVQFYAAFGAVLKEGLVEDQTNKEKIAKLLRFYSTATASDHPSVSLASYKQRMKEGQEAIYYITAESLTAAQNSPQIEVFRKKGIEVLLLTDRVDEWMLNFYTEFDGTPLQSVAKGGVDLDKLQNEQEKEQVKQANEDLKPLIERLQLSLKGKVKEVRGTIRLVDSPACLVVEDGEMSQQFARILQQSGRDAPQTTPSLEINPEHRLIKKLLAMSTQEGSDFDDWAGILFDNAVLAEGGEIDDAASYVKKISLLLSDLKD